MESVTTAKHTLYSVGKIVLFPVYIIMLILLYPGYLFYSVIRDHHKSATLPAAMTASKTRRTAFFILKLTAIITVLLPLWLSLYATVGIATASQLRLFNEPIPISGTGSMYPTFPKGREDTRETQAKEIVDRPGMLPYPNGLVLFNRRIFGREIARGDIVVFVNNTVKDVTKRTYGEEAGLVKRVIALADDTVEIRDGIVYVNNNALKEPYTARARSTFGGNFLPDCTKLTIPQGKLFVMGDNRKGSSDSRHEIGLIAFSDVDHVLPYEKQLGVYDKSWHDASADLSEGAKIRLDRTEFLQLLNKKRREHKIELLEYNKKLEASANSRGAAILQYNDFSFEATRSGLTMEKAMTQEDYANIVWGEAPITGYYEAEELIENLFEFPKSQAFLLKSQYDDIGIGEAEGTVNGCPSQVVVLHFGGYVPPNYDKAQIESWKQLLSNLKNVQPGWQELTGYIPVYTSYKTEIDRINKIIALRIENISGIVAKMEANQWLTKTQVDYTIQDSALNNELEGLVKKLNP